MDKQIKKLAVKLAAAVATLALAATVTVSVTYAWMILSTHPTVSGIAISVTGGTRIMFAPDVVRTESGITSHYPGEFTDDLRVGGDAYAYLSTLTGLTPASTADGINWVLPDGSSYTVDDTLSRANASDGSGGYVYLDFWVVAPGADYDLRVSCDAGGGSARTRGTTGTHAGSALMELPAVRREGTVFSLVDRGASVVGTTARVGFLVNHDHASDEDVTLYFNSPDADGRYTKLVGSYPEPGGSFAPGAQNTFTIWEPNALLHTDPSKNGSYLVTAPLGVTGGTVGETDVGGILTVQKNSEWRYEGTERLLDRHFETVIAGESGLDEGSATARLISGVPYLDCVVAGEFFRSTDALYSAAVAGTASADAVAALPTAGASDGGVIAHLEKNVPQRIRMFVWLEGQDADCSSALTEARNFILDLELSGS